eukprot:1124802-Pleurochrysis_carterae.AAC.1
MSTVGGGYLPSLGGTSSIASTARPPKFRSAQLTLGAQAAPTTPSKARTVLSAQILTQIFASTAC